MTPEQLIKYTIVYRQAAYDDQKLASDMTVEQINELYEKIRRDDNDGVIESVREGNIETDIESEWSRHYESKSVAIKAPNGQWVGWTYWYGGGKHAEPEAIEWMEHAYFLDCVEEEKLVTVRTFTKK